MAKLDKFLEDFVVIPGEVEEATPEIQKLIEDVPDENDTGLINYWKYLPRNRIVYLEGWCDKCLAGTGLPPMEGGEMAEKLDYIERGTKRALKEKQQEHPELEFIDGGFWECEDCDNLYGVTYGVFKIKPDQKFQLYGKIIKPEMTKSRR